MGVHRRNWSKDEKLQALRYAEKHGFSDSAREFGVSITSLYKWRDKLESGGENSLEKSNSKELNLELAKLIRENKQLKEILADKELELRIQADMLKKTKYLKKN